MRTEVRQKQTQQMIEEQKKAAALRAAEMVPHQTILGLGSGSTVKYLIEELGRRKQDGQIDIQVVTSSYESQFLANQYGIPVLVLTGINKLALTIDGADEIDTQGNAIKGKGGAQTLEKVLARLSERYILIADSTKLVEALGWGAPVPIEVIPQAVDLVQDQLSAIGCKSSIRTGDGKVGPVVTDLGNMIIDAYFESIEEPGRLARYLNNITGVLGHGLFVNMVDQAVVGVYKDGVIKTELRNYKKIKEPEYKP
jgi:ribose 5-phosphate isomerase A